MLYYLFQYLDKLDFPGSGMFQYVSFRAAMAAIIALLFSAIVGARIIKMLQKLQIGETIRDLDLEAIPSVSPTIGRSTSPCR